MARMQRGCNIFLYDPVACLFIVVMLFGFVWFCLGFVWQDTGCAANTTLMTRIALYSSILWPFLAVGVYVMAGCCQCCGGSSSHHGRIVDSESGRSAGSSNSSSSKKSTQQHLEPAPQTMQSSSAAATQPATSVGYSFPQQY
eukprot:TRINITY_DN7476_c0_g1_i1.p3 TRINITY_DN7476_c0_g1~~TRINITY_DN7476_c0_g1_i1.p3  ORF type:complete len:142 (+),score=36.70 TRINITY_DN7476_c0_g1_i1:1038-1463(+)